MHVRAHRRKYGRSLKSPTRFDVARSQSETVPSSRASNPIKFANDLILYKRDAQTFLKFQRELGRNLFQLNTESQNINITDEQKWHAQMHMRAFLCEFTKLSSKREATIKEFENLRNHEYIVRIEIVVLHCKYRWTWRISRNNIARVFILFQCSQVGSCFKRNPFQNCLIYHTFIYLFSIYSLSALHYYFNRWWYIN